ncbi:MAG: tetratricopeptide repeat protein [Bacteroidales bacterium]|nr:tetratricopeptide repeat protein [Bacteroidales bacterium]
MKKRLYNIFVCSAIGLVLLALSGCSTSKNTFPNRAYHNVTCRYNVLWNGQQAFKSAEAEMKKLSKDNYTATLPVYNYPDKSDIAPALSYLDRTIEKSSKAIYKHSMLIRGKEYVKTIDDAYLLMGKSNFYKQDYVAAQRIFQYILHNYPNANTYNEAAVMLARTAMRQGYFSMADEQLENLHYLATNKKNKKFNQLFNAAKAEYHLTAPDGEVSEAIDYLNNAIAAKPEREFRNRLHLIAGELYENLGQQEEATQHFKQVIKKTSDYNMLFCAQMHLASNYDGSESARNTITKLFDKMLDEKKNEDFKDQIYYAYSEIARVDDDLDARKDYLAKSVSASTNNNYQKTFSALTLADLYFQESDYRNAQHYYDSALLAIPKNYPNYEALQKKGNFLKDLVLKLDEIDLQDSLQRIAKMSPSERNQWVKKMIDEYTEAERKAAAEEAERMLALQNASSYSNINVNANNSGKWYFYNQSLVTAGMQDFYRRFGNRKLEDNWLVSNKQVISFDDMMVMNDPSLAKDSVEYDEDGNPIPKRETDPKKEQYYLQDLPLTPGAMDTSNAIIANNLFQVGFIYQDLLEDLPRACESFQSLVTRFPESEYTPSSIYMLYSLYSRLNNTAKADEYKQIIFSKYPDSDFAKVIQDPNYYRKIAERDKAIENYYETVYEQFNNKQWREVVQAADLYIPQSTDHNLKSKYSYLRAVAAGQLYNEDSLIRGFQHIISEYGDEPVAELARVYLASLDPAKLAQPSQQQTSDETVITDDGQVLSTMTKQNNTVAANPFVYNPDEVHYIILLVESSQLPIQTVKLNLTNFNKAYFSLQRFNISSFYINNHQQMITISKFNNASTAMDYYNILVKDPVFVEDINNKIIIAYPMSATNYTAYYNNQAGRSFYDSFVNDNYFKK